MVIIGIAVYGDRDPQRFGQFQQVVVIRTVSRNCRISRMDFQTVQLVVQNTMWNAR